VLKVRLNDFSTFVRHTTLPRPFFMSETIYGEIYTLFDNFDTHNQSIRLLGVGVTQLSSASELQLDLFEGESDEKRKKVTQVVDRLREKFGQKVIGRGGAFHRIKKS